MPRGRIYTRPRPRIPLIRELRQAFWILPLLTMADDSIENSAMDNKPEREEIRSERYPGRVVVHERTGIWDCYEEKSPDGRVPLFLGIAKQFAEVRRCSPYVVRLVKDVIGIPGCKARLGVYAITEHLVGLVPALSLW